MELEFLKEECCSICGSQTISMRKERKHCNGHYNEYREYGCKKLLHHCPNFLGKIQVLSACERSEEFLQKKSQKQIRLNKVLSYLKEDLGMSNDEIVSTINDLKDWAKR